MTGDKREILRATVTQELKAMNGEAPSELLDIVNYRMRKSTSPASEAELVELLTAVDVNCPAKTHFRIRLNGWDAADAEEWTQGEGVETEPNTVERRHLVYTLLEIDQQYWQRLDKDYPRDFSGATVISPELPWEPWYSEERRRQRSFYWDNYQKVLLGKGFSGDAVARIDGAATEVVKRLNDPARDERYQSKGLVVGHVQSGKTANFAGVIAKAIDAGYRLVIVLTGTVEILRRQTQRRLDMELIGEENILGGIDRDNYAAMADVDYHRDGDQDWFEGNFLQLGIKPVDHDGVPAIRRLTSPNWDYKRLLAGLGNLDFRQGNELLNKQKPLHDPMNLFRSDVRFAVVKKNKGTLEKLVSDLDNIHARLGEIPALIIDDEADQASVNTVRPRTGKQRTRKEEERSAINRLIAALMARLSRCQYVGYTATPFANVFVDPDDVEDVFPKDFIISLDRPHGYMGGGDFYDFSQEYDDVERTPANSNEEAFVRNLNATAGEESWLEMQGALDAFVLSGAIRLFRSHVAEIPSRHHTMLVHETVRQSDHRELAGKLRQMWARAGYSTPTGLARLRKLWEEDYRPVCEARAVDSPVPSSFDELRPYIGSAVDKIAEGTTPVLIVNGDKDKDYEQQELDFQAQGGVWKILVGGAQLSRGFTVEGLTISYFKRRAGQADTLMQAGRWFGFRPGYWDLVRLYIGRNVAGPRNTTVDLYQAFGTIVQDEEEFRSELRQYAELDEEGRPKVRPENVPPMVFQQLPWLRPTQSSKMYNAELTQQGTGARVTDFSLQPERGKGENNFRHFEAMSPVLSVSAEYGQFKYKDSNGQTREFDAYYRIVSADKIAEAIGKFVWATNWSFQPHLEFLGDAQAKGLLEDWAVLLPYLGKPAVRLIGDHPDRLPVIKRTRRDRGGFSGSSFRQRDALEHIADGTERNGGALAEELCTGTRGALLLNFAADTSAGLLPGDLPEPHVDPRDVATLFSWAVPRAAAPLGRIGFKVRKKGCGAIVDREHSQHV